MAQDVRDKLQQFGGKKSLAKNLRAACNPGNEQVGRVFTDRCDSAHGNAYDPAMIMPALRLTQWEKRDRQTFKTLVDMWRRIP